MLRNLGKKVLEIPIRIQVVCLSCLSDTVAYCTRFSSGNGVDQMPVVLPDNKASKGLLRGLSIYQHNY